MTWKKTLFERQQLFDEVWETPMLRLAETYGLSDVGLRKICVALTIPLPPRGYWARLAAGKASKKPVLPEAPGRTTYEHVSHEVQVDATLNARLSSAREATSARIAGTAEYVPPVDANAFQAQSIIVSKAIRKAKPRSGLLEISEVFWADISVSEMLLERALLLVDRTAFELLRLGAQFENSHPPVRRLGSGRRLDPNQKRNCFTLHGHQFFLRVREKTPTNSAPKKAAATVQSRTRSPEMSQHQHMPTGALQVCIVDAGRYYERYKIHDSSRGPIEIKIHKALIEAEETTLGWKLSRELSAEREVARKAKAQEWEQLKKNKDKLLSQLANFESMAKDLERARSLRRFIAEIEAKRSAPAELAENVELMKLMADWLDPMVKVPWPGVDGIGEKNPYGSFW